MNTAFKNFGIIAMTMIMAVISGCEKVDDIPVSNGNVDNNKTEVELPDMFLHQGEQNDGVDYALYDGQYNRPYSINVFVKGAKPEDIVVLPEGFNANISELRKVDELTVENKYTCYEVVITGATGMEPRKEYNIKVSASNEGGTKTVNYPISLIYIDNPFKSGAFIPTVSEFGATNHFGDGQATRKHFICAMSNIGFDIEILEDKSVAQLVLSGEDHDMDKTFHPIIRHDQHKNPEFGILVRKNITSESQLYRVRLTDANKVISYEGDVVIRRLEELTVEEEMAKELAAMKIIRDALGLKDDPDYSDNVPLNQWPGVWAPDYPNGGYFVREIEWRGPLICGQIPEAVKDLDHCTRFCLYGGHRVTGKIPDGFADMKNLRYLTLWNPEKGYGLEGRLDECSLGKIIKQLKYLGLSDNNLTGAIPEWLGDMPDYGIFSIDGNRLEGKVPEKVQNHSYWKGKDLSGKNETNGEWLMRQQPGYILYL